MSDPYWLSNEQMAWLEPQFPTSPGGGARGMEGLSAAGADRDADAGWFRNVLEDKGIKPRIRGRHSRNEPIKYDRRRYRRRTPIEIMFGRSKDCRRAATRYDRCPTIFFSAIALAATILLAMPHQSSP